MRMYLVHMYSIAVLLLWWNQLRTCRIVWFATWV